VFANYDVIKDLDEEEKNLMSLTFENTLKNSQAVKLKETPPSAPKKKSIKVNFNLEQNQYFMLTNEWYNIAYKWMI